MNAFARLLSATLLTGLLLCSMTAAQDAKDLEYDGKKLPEWTKLAASESLRDRNKAFKALQNLNHVDSFAAMFKLLGDSDQTLRDEVWVFLAGKTGGDNPKHPAEKAAAASLDLADPLAKTRTAFMIAPAAAKKGTAASEHIAKIKKVLIAAAESKDEKLISYGVGGLGKLGEKAEDCVPTLLKVANSNPKLRTDAIRALQMIVGDAGVKELRDNGKL